MATTSGAVGYMVRCTSKSCRSVRRIDFAYVTTDETRHNHAIGTTYTVRVTQYANAAYRDPKTPRIPDCDKCGSYAVGQPIKGYVNDNIACGSKCRGAIGPSCDCSCGGENHGGTHS